MINYLAPYKFNRLYARIIGVSSTMFTTLLIVGLYYALLASPPDYQQGEMVRMMYIHVPSAWMSLAIYSFIALCSAVTLIWRIRLAYLLAVSAAPIGASFALVCLVTGSLWGKPMWGAWWVWDARLTSMLILFIFYLSYIVLLNASSHIFRAEKPASVMALIGFINVPIVKFSVDIWYSLHQPASVLRLNGPSIHPSMLLPLMLMFGACIFYFTLLLTMRYKQLLNKIKSS